MQEIGLFEAKNKLSELVSRAEKGEEVTITRHGFPVARLVPARRVYDPEKARAAIEEMRKLAHEMNLGPFNWEEWKAFRDEGRP
jgi:prevent-host-death family protein